MLKNKLRILKSKFKGNISNSKGWKTRRKILVIESDDWGSIRMPSKEVYHNFIDKGFGVQNRLYNRFDSLASEDDLNHLFETLAAFKDIKGRNLVLTANTVVANPDFAKIKQNNYQEYHYELFTETLKKYPKHQDSFLLWEEGMKNKFFIPQFHAREHLNVNLWMKALQQKDKKIQYTFTQKTTFSGKSDYSFMDAFDYESKNELVFLKEVLTDGLKIFQGIFGYQSKSFIAPCYIWHPELEKTLYLFNTRKWIYNF